jgi:branched-chain amino acid transport system substrate-binding protein
MPADGQALIMRTIFSLLIVAMLAVSPDRGFAAETIRVALIDALSGPYADVGFTSVRLYQEAIADANSIGGAPGLELELVPLDDASRTDQALRSLDLAIQQGIRYVAQGSNPQVSIALAKAIDAYNSDNPNREVLFLNFGDGAMELNDEHCSFWHFRFDANIAMKLQTLIAAIPDDGSVKTIYLLNQDDPSGHGAGREAHRILSRVRPEIQIVGDEVHPVGKVRDFSAYFARINESGADAVLTADRGDDLLALMQTAAKFGGRKPIYVASNSVAEVAAAIGVRGVDRVYAVFTWHSNIGENLLDQFTVAYRAKHDEEWNGLPSYVSIQMLMTAMQTTRSSEPLQVASVIEGLSFLGASSPIAMRSDNHQLLQPLYVATLAKAGTKGATNAVGNTGLGWKTVLRKEFDQTLVKTTCEMQRPESLKKSR